MYDAGGDERRGCRKRDDGEVLSTGNCVHCLSKLLAQGGVKWNERRGHQSHLQYFGGIRNRGSL